MSNTSKIKEYQFYGPLSDVIRKYIAEKRGIGLQYNSESKRLANFDRFTSNFSCNKDTLSKEVVTAWISKRDNECFASQNLRMKLMRQFGFFMQRCGYEAYILPDLPKRKNSSSFAPYIYSDEEIERIFAYVDCWKATPQSPKGYIVYPVLFRVLYCCGLRISEIRLLKVCDVDLENGVLNIQGAKFERDRKVPMSSSVTALCRTYFKKMHQFSNDDDIYFPNAYGTHFGSTTIYYVFRKLLWKSGISHGGKGKGPRIHDFRHTFAVHCLRNWVQNGSDISSALPYLSAYLGHVGLKESQQYLKLTVDLYPEINSALENKIGHIIPSAGGDGK
jgi:integrase/recombinase XerD